MRAEVFLLLHKKGLSIDNPFLFLSLLILATKKLI